MTGFCDEAFALQDALAKEFERQTAHLGHARQIAILVSFLGNEHMAACVKLQQSQDCAPKPKFWPLKKATKKTP